MLAGWSETHNGGAKVTFWLPSADELDVFRGLTVRKGNTAGHRFMAVLVEIADDGNPVQVPPQRDVEPQRAKGGELAKLAGILCADPEFQLWLEERYDALPATVGGTEGEERAAIILRAVCGVKSRAKLDHDPVAAAKFHEIRKAWVTRDGGEK